MREEDERERERERESERWRERRREKERGRRDWRPVGLVLSYRNNESHVAATCPLLSLLLRSALLTGRLCLYSIEPVVLVLARMPFSGH